MSKFKVTGGVELKGSITPQGAKNEALQIIAASVLVQNLKIFNCPNILDVRNLLLILENGGAKVRWEHPGLSPALPTREGGNASGTSSPSTASRGLGGEALSILHLDTRELKEEYFASAEFFELAEKLRGSLMLIGPLLARYGVAYIPPVGGDKIGVRPIDTHVQGFIKIGAELVIENNLNKLILDKNKVISGEVTLDEKSVTGTANIIMASALSSNDFVLYNAACETYITQLCNLLKSIGLNVEGSMSNRLTMTNTNAQKKLKYEDMNFDKEVEHRILPDFIEVASFMALAMATRSEILIKDAGVISLGMTLRMFENLGCKFEIINDDIKVLKQENYKIVKTYADGLINIKAEPWPQISPDILSVGIVAALQCDGVVLFHDYMYEARLFFVDKLIAMGGQMVLCDPHRVVVTGNNWKSKLKARNVTSPDIRAGIALLIAALGAEGDSIIDNVDQIDRGYENIETRLAKLGAKIERIN